MLAATELRIGNYVSNQAGELNGRLIGKPHSIVAADLSSPALDLYLPIPLTEEWLVRFDWGGYKEKFLNSYFKIDDNGCVWYCGDFTGLTIRYVHQLQNLYFALTGQELELK